MSAVPFLLPAVTFTMVAIALIAMAVLRGWSGWLALKQLELGGGRSRSSGGGADLTSLKERVRALEAIANGIEGRNVVGRDS